MNIVYTIVYTYIHTYTYVYIYIYKIASVSSTHMKYVKMYYYLHSFSVTTKEASVFCLTYLVL